MLDGEFEGAAISDEDVASIPLTPEQSISEKEPLTEP
jgi:hypothetical protein